MKLPQLDSLLAYKHKSVIQSYIRNYPAEADRAEQLFVDMLTYLWITVKHDLDRRAAPAKRELDFTLVMHQEMLDMDNMWHNFILYTKDYTEFCRKFFGEYLHHEPDVAAGPPPSEAQFTTEMEKYLSYLIENLGEKTAARWFAVAE